MLQTIPPQHRTQTPHNQVWSRRAEGVKKHSAEVTLTIAHLLRGFLQGCSQNAIPPHIEKNSPCCEAQADPSGSIAVLDSQWN